MGQGLGNSLACRACGADAGQTLPLYQADFWCHVLMHCPETLCSTSMCAPSALHWIMITGGASVCRRLLGLHGAHRWPYLQPYTHIQGLPHYA